MKNVSLLALLALMLILMPGIGTAGSLRVGEPVIVASDMGGHTRQVSQYQVALGLGIVTDVGSSEHEVKIYEAVCGRSNTCNFYPSETKWVEESAMVRSPTTDVDHNMKHLDKKGINPEKYNPCQLECVTFYLGDN